MILPFAFRKMFSVFVTGAMLMLKSNQLIVGPESWSYQVLRQTIGERFMASLEVSVFIDQSDAVISDRCVQIIFCESNDVGNQRA